MPRRDIPDTFASKVGARIRDLRLEKHMSILDLERASGVSKGHISNVEHGLVAVNMTTAERLARGLRVEVVDLVVFPEKKGRHGLMERARRMSLREIERLSEILETVASTPPVMT